MIFISSIVFFYYIFTFLDKWIYYTDMLMIHEYMSLGQSFLSMFEHVY